MALDFWRDDFLMYILAWSLLLMRAMENHEEGISGPLRWMRAIIYFFDRFCMIVLRDVFLPSKYCAVFFS